MGFVTNVLHPQEGVAHRRWAAKLFTEPKQSPLPGRDRQKPDKQPEQNQCTEHGEQSLQRMKLEQRIAM